MRGWPAAFVAWPGRDQDNFGPLWRVETSGTAEAMALLTDERDQAMLAALVGVLPDAAHRAARSAGLAAVEAEAWTERAERLAGQMRG
jgi:hypothetical protein